ncbi:outer membrane protein assembly factor BamC [Psychrobium sp. 1_MG-2023]|uniref:outer membrane protein assembly factor BamC n=1 Tax=Psychrobium sp. 1_MG-2023 TaxID=3062624 RepID=UPI00273668FF|nr:outer membrane protein assembly factor BamC [Psychrobium sp. 1_MG-2023]MDP2562420.1 outer membrane protein assembly factor BamC [Psychrobium sp. 1_MG-2023]
MRKLCIALCGGIALSGCSSFSERHQASGNFEFLNEKQQQAITVPENLTPLKVTDKFTIPRLGESAGQLMGPELDIRAPALIMPVAPNSLVSDNNKQVEVYFESFMAADKFRNDLWQKLNLFIDDLGYGVGIELEGQSLTTRLIDSDPFFKAIFGLDDDHSLAQQYQFSIAVEEQGHKAVVKVALVEHQELGLAKELTDFAKRRYEARMLNQFLSHVASEHNKQAIANRIKAKDGIKIKLAIDSEQHTVYELHAEFEQAWEKLATVLPKLGFEVEDRDKTLNAYFTTFDEMDVGFWTGLFSSDDVLVPIELEKGSKYQVRLSKQGDVSLLSILDAKGNNLPAEKMTEMFNTFNKVMASRQL